MTINNYEVPRGTGGGGGGEHVLQRDVFPNTIVNITDLTRTSLGSREKMKKERRRENEEKNEYFICGL
jgi:hypothetical protein